MRRRGGNGTARAVLLAVSLLLALTGLFLGMVPKAASIPLSPEFTDQLVADVGSPTALAFTPDGRLLITTQPGRLLVYRDGVVSQNPALDLSIGNRICANRERGLLGVA